MIIVITKQIPLPFWSLKQTVIFFSLISCFHL